MPYEHEPLDRADAIPTDLIEYVVIMVPDRAKLAGLVPALAALVQAAAIRILDLVAVLRADDGELAVHEFDEVESLAELWHVEGEIGGLLNDNDVRLAARALAPGTAGIVLVTQDRWLEPLSAAAHRVGGQIVAGERIPPRRVEAALDDIDAPSEGG